MEWISEFLDNNLVVATYQILSFHLLLSEHGANMGDLGLIHPAHVIPVKQNRQVVLNIPTQYEVPHHEVRRVEQLQDVLLILQVAGDDSLNIIWIITLQFNYKCYIYLCQLTTLQ